MTRQDIIGIKELIYTKEMYFDPERSTVVCARHNTELFGGKLKARKFTGRPLPLLHKRGQVTPKRQRRSGAQVAGNGSENLPSST